MIDDMNVQPDAAPTGSGAILVNIFTAPREAFAALAARPTVLLPILALIIGNMLLIGWYYTQVDIPWLIQTTIEASGQEVPPGLAEQQGGPAVMIVRVLAIVGAALQIMLVLLLMAGYLSLASLFTNDGVRFKRWLSLAAWSSMPTLLGVLSGLVNLAVNDGTFMPPTELNLLSFGNLLGMEAMGGGTLRSILLNLDVTMLWALALMAIGYRLWTGRSVAASFAIVAAPLIVVAAVALLLTAL